MGRGSTQILIRKIIECLAEGSKSITEISEKTGLDRTAIGKYVNILKESGILIEDQEGTSKRFTLVPTFRTDTYFGLPLDENAEKQMSSLYHLIKKKWQTKTQRKLLNTHAQKIAYKVIVSCNLKIPCGWYIYGGIGLMSYNDDKEYNYYGLPKEVENSVDTIATEYAENLYAYQSKNKLYEEFSKELYLLKEDILKILYSPKFDEHPKNSLFVMNRKLRRLISLAPKDDRENYRKILDAYQDLMLDVTNKLDEKGILTHKREITLLFETLWRYIALFNFKQDLRQFYSEQILNKHFYLDVMQQEDEIIDIATQLQEIIPEQILEDSIKKKLYDALAQIKLLSPEEQQEQKKKLQKLKKELGEEKFQQWLFEQTGLK